MECRLVAGLPELDEENTMSLMTWNPFTEFDSLLRRRSLSPSQNSGSLDWQPAADISETESEYVIRADLPAVKKEDIELSVHNGVITLSGERRSRTEDTSEKQHRIEKFYGKFTRSFALPEDVNEQAISASQDEGVLTVLLPKVDRQEPSSISIDVS